MGSFEMKSSASSSEKTDPPKRLTDPPTARSRDSSTGPGNRRACPWGEAWRPGCPSLRPSACNPSSSLLTSTPPPCCRLNASIRHWTKSRMTGPSCAGVAASSSGDAAARRGAWVVSSTPSSDPLASLGPLARRSRSPSSTTAIAAGIMSLTSYTRSGVNQEKVVPDLVQVIERLIHNLLQFTQLASG